MPGSVPHQTFSEGIGIFYEKASEYIFNSKTEAGKVMGLAPFGKSSGIHESRVDYLNSLNWEKQFKGRGKKEWEASPYLEEYKKVAATVQENFENFLFQYLDSVKKHFPNENNLVITGGCALNCTFNGKLARKKIFQKIYIPPNPGDEGISMGCAFSSYLRSNKEKWKPLPWEQLISSRGLKSSVPSDLEIEETFKGYMVTKNPNMVQQVAKELASGEIIAFYQGRSEVGPRALGSRSILASPVRRNLKNYLNENVKFREDFRPYGCTVQWDKAHLFFEIDQGFENPFMSFAVPVRSKFIDVLRDLSHVDGTSRMQTLHRGQNEVFYDLLGEMEKLTGLPILLNTSLNVMNEPIVETIQDAKRFLDGSCLNTLVANGYIIKKRNA